jgi:hypothetical protein
MTPAVVLLVVRLLLAVCLYAFLAAVLIVLWRDLRRGGVGLALPAPAAHLVPLGPAAAPAAAFPLGEINLLGRASDNTIRIDDVTVSSHHARIAFRSGQWILEDLGSRNGTRVNGIAVEGLLVVTFGDDLQFGEVMLGLRPGQAPEALSSGDESPGSSERRSQVG